MMESMFPGMVGGGMQMAALMPPPGSMPNMPMGGFQYGTGYGG